MSRETGKLIALGVNPTSIDFYDPDSLTQVSTFKQGPSIYPNDLYPDGSYLFAAFSDYSEVDNAKGLVIKNYVNTMQVLKEWEFKDIVKDILVLKGSNKMIAYTYNSLISGKYCTSWLVSVTRNKQIMKTVKFILAAATIIFIAPGSLSGYA